MSPEISAVIIDENLIGIWYLQISEGSDWLASLSADGPDRFKLVWRFRYYVDNKAHDSRDRKSWGRLTSHPNSRTREQALEKAREAAHILEQRCGNRATEILMKNGDVDAFMREFSAQPWAHVKIEKLH